MKRFSCSLIAFTFALTIILGVMPKPADSGANVFEGNRLVIMVKERGTGKWCRSFIYWGTPREANTPHWNEYHADGGDHPGQSHGTTYVWYTTWRTKWVDDCGF